VKELLGGEVKDFSDEQTYYEPRFFQKQYDAATKTYKYLPRGNLYWELREKQDWSSVPRIFDDDCEPFY
jgi:hypothetical protein